MVATAPTMQQRIESFTSSPAFDGRYGLLIVRQDYYEELECAGLPADARLAECGYKSVVINGVPVIYSADYTGNDFLPIEKELIGILANNHKEKE